MEFTNTEMSIFHIPNSLKIFILIAFIYIVSKKKKKSNIYYRYRVSLGALFNFILKIAFV